MGYFSNISVYNLSLQRTSNVDRSNKNGFALKKARRRPYLAETITDVDYADHIALLANPPNQAEFLLYRLE